MATLTQTSAKPSTWGAILLIAGGCIGGGMLAMPVQTAAAGFFPSLLTMLLCWLFMMFTGLLLAEANLWMKQKSHFTSMAEALLGKWGKGATLILCLFMSYASVIAYLSGAAVLMAHWVKKLFDFQLTYGGSCGLCLLILGSVIYMGAHFISKINAFLVAAMIAAYVGIISVGLPNVHMEPILTHMAWKRTLGAFSIILVAFSYQMMVPSVCNYLNHNHKEIKKSIIWGTTIPLLVYIVWQLVIHGVVPYEGAGGLKEALTQGLPATEPLRVFSKNLFLSVAADLFAFFAIVTSFLGISLGLFDFFDDFAKNAKTSLSRNSKTVLVFGPTLFIAVLFPKALLDFLDLTGGFGDAILSGLIPLGMVWVGRYIKKLDSSYETFGGKPGLILAAGFALMVFVMEVVKLVF